MSVPARPVSTRTRRRTITPPRRSTTTPSCPTAPACWRNWPGAAWGAMSDLGGRVIRALDPADGPECDAIIAGLPHFFGSEFYRRAGFLDVREYRLEGWDDIALPM